jgi:hypothetical protein
MGINPVTFSGEKWILSGTGEGFTIQGTLQRGPDKINVSMGRLHIGSKVEAGMSAAAKALAEEFKEKLFTIVVWDGEPDSPNIIAHSVLDEDHFIRGIKQLFPNGELNV